MEKLASQPPFSSLEKSDLIEWLKSAKRLKYGPGERLIRPDEINSDVSLVLTGSIRLIAIGEEEEGSFTLDKRGPGQLIGWTSLLRGAPSEFVIASTDVVVLSLPADNFVHFIREVPEFAIHFCKQSNQHEAYIVAVKSVELQAKRSSNWRDGLLERVKQARTSSLDNNTTLENLPELPTDWCWHLSTPDVPGVPVGTALLHLRNSSLNDGVPASIPASGLTERSHNNS